MEQPAGEVLAAYTRILPQLRRIAGGFGFDDADRRDLLQGVYLTGTTRPPAYRTDAELEHWWRRVTLNACRLEYRRRARFRRVATRLRERAAGWSGAAGALGWDLNHREGVASGE